MSVDELCSSVKEPEEADHEAKCHLLHDGSTSDQRVSETSNDWLNILGHDRLRKRVSYLLHFTLLLRPVGLHSVVKIGIQNAHFCS